jgi:hypothetical protein
MNTRYNVKSGSGIEQQLSSVNMSQYERNAVLHDLSIAELFVDAIEWACRKQRPHEDVFAKHNLKY